MVKVRDLIYNTIAIGVGVGFVLFLAAIKRIEDNYDPTRPWE